MMKPRFIALAVVAAGVSSGAYYAGNGRTRPSEIVSAPASRGDIVQTVVATGALEAVTTVQVGSQVSGTVEALYADFNSIVRKGQTVARLEPSAFESEVEQARANLVRAQADVDRLAVALDDARVKLARARVLADKQLLAAADLDAAEVQVRSAEAQQRSAEAQVKQALASLTQAEVNLQKTVITAPIDGFVVARNVDVGQTVAASLQAPTLFVIAADLTRMRVNAAVDESDVGRVKPGQPVLFRVDAYPNEPFRGRVAQVRLSPVLLQNVVTYATVIDVPNPDLKLKPGMTATVDIETARQHDVVRVPSAALHFTPTAAMLDLLGQPRDLVAPASERRASDSGTVWVRIGQTVVPKNVQTGFTNGTLTELVAGDVSEGAEIVTTITVREVTTATPAVRNPMLMMQPGRGRPGG
jgi:HlyD family secretion protein